MRHTRAEPRERCDVLLHGVSLVLREAVARVGGVELAHHRVARGLREDRRRRDGEAQRVAFDDALLRDRHVLQAPRVDEEMLRRHDEAFDGALHREEPGPVDVDGVDLLDRGDADRPRRRRGLDLHRETLSLLGVELLRVVDVGDAAARREHDRRGVDRSGERAHAGLVDTRHVDEPVDHSTCSKRSILRSRWPSARCACRRLATASSMAFTPGRGSARSSASSAAGSECPALDVTSRSSASVATLGLLGLDLLDASVGVLGEAAGVALVHGSVARPRPAAEARAPVVASSRARSPRACSSRTDRARRPARRSDGLGARGSSTSSSPASSASVRVALHHERRVLATDARRRP